MPQTRKPPSGPGVGRKEFDDLAEVVARNQSRIEALEKNDKDLEERMNGQLAEVKRTITAVQDSQQEVSQKIDAFVGEQGEANKRFQQSHDELKKSSEKMEGVMDRIEGFIKNLEHAFRLDEDEGLGEFREDQTFLRRIRKLFGAGGGFAFNAVIGLVVTGVGSLLVAGVLSHFGVKP